MAIKIIRQFMAENRHRLPPSKEGLKEFATRQAAELNCSITNEQLEQLAAEFEQSPVTPILATKSEALHKPLRKR